MHSMGKVLIALAVVLHSTWSAPRAEAELGVVSEAENDSAAGTVNFKVKEHAKEHPDGNVLEKRGENEGKQLFKDDHLAHPSGTLSLPSPHEIYLEPNSKNEQVDRNSSPNEVTNQEEALFIKPLNEIGETPQQVLEIFGDVAQKDPVSGTTEISIFSYDYPSPVSPAASLSRLYGLPEKTDQEVSAPSVNVPVKVKLIEEETAQSNVEVPSPNKKNMMGMLMPFSYEWEVQDPDNVDLQFSHTSSSDGQVTQGEYRVLLPDGRLQVVRYTDDGNGFFPEISYI